jgi:hypothetical protein
MIGGDSIRATFFGAISLVFWLPTFITLKSIIRLSIWFFRLARLSPIFPKACNNARKWLNKYAESWVYGLTLEILGESVMPKVYAVKPEEVREVTLPSEEDVKVEDRTIFLITSPDVRDFARIQDELYEVQGFGRKRSERFRTGDQQLQILKIGLKGWKKFTDANGKKVEWKELPEGSTPHERESILLENINRISEANRGELVDLIRGEASVSQD